MHDLVIRNARIVDGTGAPEFHGDVAISGQTITHVGEVDGGGRREIDAAGNLSTSTPTTMPRPPGIRIFYRRDGTE